MPADTKQKILRQPSDPNIKVWRYMDFTKYISLLESSSLWFSRIDQLGDPFEASWTAASDQVFEKMLVPGLDSAEAAEKLRRHIAGGRKTFRDCTYVSCWHWGNHESAAMWRLYSQTDEAIAVQTSYSRLANVLPNDVLLGLVEYVDYDTFEIGIGNVLKPAAHKRLSYEHEREVRALRLFGLDQDGDPKSRPLGIAVPIDLAALVEKVYVAPNSAPWYDQLVRATTARMSWKFDIASSRLSERPIF